MKMTTQLKKTATVSKPMTVNRPTVVTTPIAHSMPETATVESKVPLTSFSHLTLWVGNAKQFSRFLQTTMGFEIIAYSGLETGERQRASWVLRNGDVIFEVASALGEDNDMGEFLHLHGDGVRDVCFTTTDVEKVYEHAVRNGAESLAAPITLKDKHGSAKMAAIKSIGDTTHTFVDRTQYTGAFLPGYEARPAVK